MKTNKKRSTNAERKRKLIALKSSDHIHFSGNELCEQISLCRMPKPEGKIYKDQLGGETL